jgi:hypothetical protein
MIGRWRSIADAAPVAPRLVFWTARRSGVEPLAFLARAWAPARAAHRPRSRRACERLGATARRRSRRARWDRRLPRTSAGSSRLARRVRHGWRRWRSAKVRRHGDSLPTARHPAGSDQPAPVASIESASLTPSRASPPLRFGLMVVAFAAGLLIRVLGANAARVSSTDVRLVAGVVRRTSAQGLSFMPSHAGHPSHADMAGETGIRSFGGAARIDSSFIAEPAIEGLATDRKGPGGLVLQPRFPTGRTGRMRAGQHPRPALQFDSQGEVEERTKPVPAADRASRGCAVRALR